MLLVGCISAWLGIVHECVCFDQEAIYMYNNHWMAADFEDAISCSTYLFI
jgi:hypothetical protein